MDDKMKLTPDTEKTEVTSFEEDAVSVAEEDVTIEDTVIKAPVTEADVVAAFNNAEKSLLSETSAAEDVAAVADEAEQIDFLSNMDLNVDDSADNASDAEYMQQPEEMQMPEGVPAETPNEAEQDEQIELTAVVEAAQEEDDEEDEKAVPRKSRGSGCLVHIIFGLLIVMISIALAVFITTAIFDVTGLNRNNKEREVIIPSGATTDEVAVILKENGLIDYEVYFRWYVRFMNLDDKWRAGSFSLQADMGFPTLINVLQAQPPRKTVVVTFREGLKVPQMAELLEEKGVCSANEFINAVRYGDYDYEFIRHIPTEADDPAYANRAYRLEGYLFPDTYEFYVDSLGETVVDRMLQNFESKISKTMLAQIKDNGWTLDQAVIMASMVQGEGDTRENMDKVSRVMHNRLKPDSGFTKFQFCSTRDYANYLLDIKWDSYDAETLKMAYNTYIREGLPVGAINSPGLDAFNAILYPSVDEDIMQCYYFATDKKGITHFAKTAKEHEANIKKYDIEDLG